MLRREAFFTSTRSCCIMSGGECHDPKFRDRVDCLKIAAIWLSCNERDKGGGISDKALSACASHLAELGCGYEGDRCKRRHNWSEAIAVSLMSPRQGETSWHAYAEYRMQTPTIGSSVVIHAAERSILHQHEVVLHYEWWRMSRPEMS
ncbi:unnamed protein product [Linum trigynum]|uniref:Uncharacterized protein n=1 Tax=Linum trigynum TaxID=586398 RepID=A0AAV2E0T3_9ROSI